MNDLGRGLIELCGEDSLKFLQGQVSCDLNNADNKIIRGCHCTPQGRVIFLFSAQVESQQRILLETHRSIVETAVASLSKYAVFSKTEITDISDQQSYLEPPLTPIERLRLGIPDITVDTTEQFIPQMLNLDLLDYISFKKGCYTGQEVVARAHYRGQVKRRMYHLSLTSASTASANTAILDSDGKQLGSIVNAVSIDKDNIEALAVLSSKALDCNYLFIENQQVAVTYHPMPYQSTDDA
jgi:folate-binding protein YgfZ